MGEKLACGEYKRTPESSLCVNCKQELDQHAAGAVPTLSPECAEFKKSPDTDVCVTCGKFANEHKPVEKTATIRVMRVHNYRTRYTYDVFEGHDQKFELSVIENDPEELAKKITRIMQANTSDFSQMTYKLKSIEVLE
jgi:hypothetical protein